MAKNKKNLDPAEYPDWLDHDLWRDFIQFRIEIGKPIYEIGEKRMFKKLERLGIADYEEILDRSIRNNWQDVYALPAEMKTQQGGQKAHSDGLFRPDEHL